MSVSPIPEGYHSLTAYLICKGATEAIEFYKKAFNAEEVMRLDMPGGMIGHAELKIGTSHLMPARESVLHRSPAIPGQAFVSTLKTATKCSLRPSPPVALRSVRWWINSTVTDQEPSSTRSAMSGPSVRTSKI